MTICSECGKKHTLKGYCSRDCQKKARKRCTDLFERREEVLDDVFEMIPEHWETIRNKLALKYKMGFHSFGRMFLQIVSMNFKTYPSRYSKMFVVYKSGQEDEARIMYRKSWDKLDDFTKDMILTQKHKRDKYKDKALNMWNTGMNADTIAQKIGVTPRVIKKIIELYG